MKDQNKTVWNIEQLKEWDKNPRNITKKGLARLKKQIKELGQYKPLLVTPEGIVLGGNMRLKAYKELGMTDIWVSIIHPKDENEMVKYSLSDNDRVGHYEEDKLNELISGVDITLEDYAVDFGEPTLLSALDEEIEGEEDEAPIITEGEAISRVGEIYQLGNHRLMCGDSTNLEDVTLLMSGKKADMVFTDPPYNVAFSPSSENKQSVKKVILNDELSDDDFAEFLDKSLVSLITFSKENSFYYVCCNWENYHVFYLAMQKYLKNMHTCIVWDKQVQGLGFAYRPQHEFILFGSNNKSVVFDDKTEANIWEFPSANSFVFRKEELGNAYEKIPHPTMKPVKLVIRALKNTSKKGDIILDLFGGSGTTLIACEQSERTCYMMELDPLYCDVIRKRYAKLLGKEESWETATPKIP